MTLEAAAARLAARLAEGLGGRTSRKPPVPASVLARLALDIVLVGGRIRTATLIDAFAPSVRDCSEIAKALEDVRSATYPVPTHRARAHCLCTGRPGVCGEQGLHAPGARRIRSCLCARGPCGAYRRTSHCSLSACPCLMGHRKSCRMSKARAATEGRPTFSPLPPQARRSGAWSLPVDGSWATP